MSAPDLGREKAEFAPAGSLQDLVDLAHLKWDGSTVLYIHPPPRLYPRPVLPMRGDPLRAPPPRPISLSLPSVPAVPVGPEGYYLNPARCGSWTGCGGSTAAGECEAQHPTGQPCTPVWRSTLPCAMSNCNTIITAAVKTRGLLRSRREGTCRFCGARHGPRRLKGRHPGSSSAWELDGCRLPVQGGAGTRQVGIGR